MFSELFVLKNVWLQYMEEADARQNTNEFYQLLKTDFI